MQSDRTALQQEKILIYSCATTYCEYEAASSRREFLQIRRREIRLSPEEQAYFTTYPDPVHWLVIATDDSPDSLAVLPVLAHVAALVPRLSLRVVREDEAAQAIEPLLDQWIAEHPEYESLAEDESLIGQAAYALLLEQLLHEVRLWYNSSLNKACAEELCALLARWHDESIDEE